MRYDNWDIEYNHPGEKLSAKNLLEIFLKNRGLKKKKEKKEFLDPKHPFDIKLKDIKIDLFMLKKTIKRLKRTKKKKEKVIVFGDYDADGICATAILWEALYGLSFDALPYIPDRFSEGYGIKAKSIRELKEKYPDLGLIITVDNGIVAFSAVQEAKKLGIDVIITDHHQASGKLPSAHAIIHTTQIGGAAVAWFVARQIRKEFASSDSKKGLDLACIGTVADQIPLIHANRSIVKHGLTALRKTKRPGLKSLFKEAGINSESIDTYHIGFVIAPRINAMGRLKHGIYSLRLLCTPRKQKALDLSYLLGKTNQKRQEIVEKVASHARKAAQESDLEPVVVLSHPTYHEGVIGLAASKIVEEFYRPAIVISKGKKKSKASARSISGFNIIEAIRSAEEYLESAGGHPMAAGFSIKTEKIELFKKKLFNFARPLLTDDILSKVLKIDALVDFSALNWKLWEIIKKLEPFGMGNPRPTFLSEKVKIKEVKLVGRDKKHTKLMLSQKKRLFSAIAFNFSSLDLQKDDEIDISYNLDENVWNGRRSLQLKIKDMRRN